MSIIAEAAAILTKGRIVDLSKARFFFMGIPAAMGGLYSFPIRAVAIEPGD